MKLRVQNHCVRVTYQSKSNVLRRETDYLQIKISFAKAETAIPSLGIIACSLVASRQEVLYPLFHFVSVYSNLCWKLIPDLFVLLGLCFLWKTPPKAALSSISRPCHNFSFFPVGLKKPKCYSTRLFIILYVRRIY